MPHSSDVFDHSTTAVDASFYSFFKETYVRAYLHFILDLVSMQSTLLWNLCYVGDNVCQIITVHSFMTFSHSF